MMSSIFVWTLDSVLWCVGMGLFALAGIGLLFWCIVSKFGTWFLDKRWNDDDEDEQD